MIQGVETRVDRRRGSPVDRLSELFGERVQLRYTCLDRIVLHGYLTGLQRPGQLVHFFHDVVGVACIEPKVLLGRTTAYRAWVAHGTLTPRARACNSQHAGARTRVFHGPACSDSRSREAVRWMS